MLRDHLRPGGHVLFVGITPGIRSATIGHYFAGYSNRFWTLLHESGLVPEPIGTQDDGPLQVGASTPVVKRNRPRRPRPISPPSDVARR